MNPQPFWTSKAFWTLTIALAFNILNKAHIIMADTDVVFYTNTVLGLLALVFRWTADQPLTVSGGQRNAPPTLPSGDRAPLSRLTKD